METDTWTPLEFGPPLVERHTKCPGCKQMVVMSQFTSIKYHWMCNDCHAKASSSEG